MSIRISEQEIRNKATELTLAVCKVANTISQNEILKTVLKEQAFKILKCASYFVSAGKKTEGDQVVMEIALIHSYLKIGRNLALSGQLNFDVLDRGYQNLKDLVNITMALLETDTRLDLKTINHTLPEKVVKKASAFSARQHLESQQKPSPKRDINERQRIILEYLKERHMAKVSDFFSAFNGLSPKTIQRDLQNLVERHILAKEGEKRWTTYTLVNVQ